LIEEEIMHSYEAPDGTKFHHNSDFSGNAIVVLKSGDKMEVPCQAILAFVADQYVRPEKIDEVEQMGITELLTGRKADNGQEVSVGLPQMSKDILILISRYGDVRANQENSAYAQGELTSAILEWGAALASGRRQTTTA
jgi:hypothetical protein